MNYNPRAEYDARMKKLAEENGTVSHEADGVDATNDTGKNGGTSELDSKTQTSSAASGDKEPKIPEQSDTASNTVQMPTSPNILSTTDAAMPTDADTPPETPVEPYNTSESPEKLAAGVVSEIKKVEEGVTQVITEDRAIGELENVAQEMMDIIATKGAMSACESAMAAVAIQNALRNVEDNSIDLPSMESFNMAHSAAAATEVSLEGVVDKIRTLIDQAYNQVERGVRNLAGLAQSLSPYLGRLKTRAQAAESKINNSNRESGLKTVSGAFVGSLSLDGNTPSADSVVKTAKYTVSVANELFGDHVWGVGERYGKLAADAAAEMASETNFTAKGASHLWWILLGHLGTVVFTVKSIMRNEKTLKELRLDTSKFPSLQAAFPTIAKVAHGLPAEGRTENLTGKRSLPLFGNKAILVTDFKPQVRVGTASSDYPKISLIDLASNKDSRAGEIQTLTSAQQKAVIGDAISTIEYLERYYASFGTKSKTLLNVFNRAFKAGMQAKEGPSTTNRYVPLAVKRTAMIFMDGILGQQGKIARQFGSSAGALVDYVMKSGNATQADDPNAGKAAANRDAAEN